MFSLALLLCAFLCLPTGSALQLQHLTCSDVFMEAKWHVALTKAEENGLVHKR